jgi:hypothetical protein
VDSVDGLPTTTANAPTISVLLPTGLVETRTISSIAGSVFTVSVAFSEAPNAQSVFLIETNDIQANLFRVISVAEGDGGAFLVALHCNITSRYMPRLSPISTLCCVTSVTYQPSLIHRFAINWH